MAGTRGRGTGHAPEGPSQEWGQPAEKGGHVEGVTLSPTPCDPCPKPCPLLCLQAFSLFPSQSLMCPLCPYLSAPSHVSIPGLCPASSSLLLSLSLSYVLIPCPILLSPFPVPILGPIPFLIPIMFLSPDLPVSIPIPLPCPHPLSPFPVPIPSPYPCPYPMSLSPVLLLVPVPTPCYPPLTLSLSPCQSPFLVPIPCSPPLTLFHSHSVSPLPLPVPLPFLAPPLPPWPRP